jgi:hypothetical protein
MDWLSGLISTVADFGIAGPVSYLTGLFKNLFLIIIPNTIIPLLNNVMSYQNFFSDGVNTGWEITRNFANLFFALILLIIAIATVLNISALDNYTAKRMLPNFIFVALFINFSKAIVGILIDISQIIMISFYNSFGPSMADTIGAASKIAEAASESNTEVVFLNIFTIVILAFLAFVLLWTALILAMRIVTLWFIIMFSPLAFMATLIPGLKSISDDWKKQLQEALVVGPTLMFFLYLAFAVMSNGISANTTTTGGDNLINNGNLINYVLVIGLLFLANTTATKAGQAAPPFLQKAVGVAGSIATLGIGAKVGAGGTGFRQGLKDGWSATGGKVVSGVDGAISGTTRGVQVLSGGKINPNDRYEMWKAKNKENTEKGKAFGGGYFGAVAQQTLGGEAGKKERFNETQLNAANQAKATDTLHQDPALLRARNAAVAKATEELKGTSVPELIEKFKEETDEIEREAIFAKITELEGLKDLLADDKFKKYAEQFETESEQINALIADEFESTTTKDSQGNEIKTARVNPTRSDRDFRSRIAKIGKDKKQGAYVSGIDNFNIVRDPQNNNQIVKDARGNTLYNRTAPTNKPKEDSKKLSITEMGKSLKTNRSSFQKRKSTTVNGVTTFNLKPDGTPDTELDFSIIDNAILNSSERLLEDPKTWASYNSTDIQEIKTAIQQNIRQSPNRGVYDKYQAALKGIG